MTTTKYKAKHAYYSPSFNVSSDIPFVDDCIQFDSKFELQVFLELKKNLGQYDKFIHRQEMLVIKPPTSNYAPKGWKCDFMIHAEAGCVKRYIEAKGLVTREFKLQLQLLEFFNPIAWENLIIVTAGVAPIKVDRRKWSTPFHCLRDIDFTDAITLPF